MKDKMKSLVLANVLTMVPLMIFFLSQEPGDQAVSYAFGIAHVLASFMNLLEDKFYTYFLMISLFLCSTILIFPTIGINAGWAMFIIWISLIQLTVNLSYRFIKLTAEEL